jgi:hypothetical protein
MKKIILLLILTIAIASCSKSSKDETILTTSPTDFKTLLTNGNSKEWIINDCLTPFYYPSPRAVRTIWTFKNDNTAIISSYYDNTVYANLTWSYNESNKLLTYYDSNHNELTSIYIIDFNANAINASKIETFSGVNFISSFSTAEVGCAVGFVKK